MAAAKDVYFVARDLPESHRLEKQHNIYMRCQGYYLHPSVTKTLSPDARVAELATGTSIWLQELSQLNPKFECHGFDISDAMFPTSSQPNVKLHVHNAKVPFDAQWNNYFDAVHIRLLVSAMAIDDWAVVLKNAVALLKPGGWLQWTECDPFHGSLFPCRSAPSKGLDRFPYTSEGSQSFTPAPRSAIDRMSSGILTHDFATATMWGIQNLKRLYEAPEVGGLTEVFVDSFNSDAIPELRTEFTAMLMNAGSSVARLRCKTQEEWEKFEALYKEALDEVAQGTYLVHRIINFIGRRPVA